MNDTAPISLSTRQASRLLSVHESSVKRWCNAGDLDCWLTPGGHRRIPVESLIKYAHANALTSPIDTFGEHAGEVWAAVDSASRSGDLDSLATLCYHWLEDGMAGSVVDLFLYALAEADHDPIELHSLLDAVVGYTMGRVGTQYHEGSFSIGDEHRMTQAMRDVLVTLFTIRSAKDHVDGPRAVIGCGRTEEHELGALVVRLLLQEAGWRVTYLGLNVPTEEFATQQASLGAQLVCISLMKPRGLSDAKSIVRLLDKVYDPAQPYQLVLGGSAVTDVVIDDREEARIPRVLAFESVQPFVQWLTKYSNNGAGARVSASARRQPAAAN